MSIIVKGVNLPSSCTKCFIVCGDSTCDDEDFFFKLEEKICEDCQLSELPEHHGRLIDADALLRESLADGTYGYVSTKQIYDAPTIIEAEGAKKED